MKIPASKVPAQVWADSYDKTGGIGLAPLIAVAGASSVACLTLAHRLGKGDDGEKTIA